MAAVLGSVESKDMSDLYLYMTSFLIYIHVICLVTYQMFKRSLYLLKDTSIHALLSHTGAQAGSEHIYIRPTLLHFTMDPLKMLALPVLGFY